MDPFALPADPFVLARSLPPPPGPATPAEHLVRQAADALRACRAVADSAGVVGVAGGVAALRVSALLREAEALAARATRSRLAALDSDIHEAEDNKTAARARGQPTDEIDAEIRGLKAKREEWERLILERESRLKAKALLEEEKLAELKKELAGEAPPAAADPAPRRAEAAEL